MGHGSIVVRTHASPIQKDIAERIGVMYSERNCTYLTHARTHTRTHTRTHARVHTCCYGFQSLVYIAFLAGLVSASTRHVAQAAGSSRQFWIRHRLKVQTTDSGNTSVSRVWNDRSQWIGVTQTDSVSSRIPIND